MFHPSDFSGFVNEAVWSTAQRKLRANFREVAIVPFGEGKRLINTIAHHQCLNASISSYSLSFEGITWPDPTSLGAHQSTSSHDDKLFGLTQISQVFMNIDYKLKQIAGKIFTTWFLMVMKNYCLTLKYPFHNRSLRL